ncbi:MAG: UDP-N-acetylmuramoyl-L-alanyl-D-glutamate--2,6-diaminopimelate ligase [bacterium]|nr:UDP-N-acetylmuramoyl-L-alanyl-D-glutamate--2,6-diaminopimelate ligase [bacterium]
MKLQKLISDLGSFTTSGKKDIEINGIASDSNNVKSGFIFISIKGLKADGHNFINDAISRGAAALIVEKDVEVLEDITIMRVPDTKKILPVIADTFYNYPSNRMSIIGVTGTNGKTTTTYFIDQIFRKAGHKTGIIGTINYQIGDRIIPAVNTTPDPIQLRALLNQMLEVNTEIAVMEVSSHAIAQRRIAGIEFDTCIFTNLTPEHLDYHETFGKYQDTKLQLFEQMGKSSKKNTAKKAIINIDDPVSRRFFDVCQVDIITYGLNTNASVYATDIRSTLNGSCFKLRIGSESIEVKINLTGKYNIYNALAATSAALAFGLSLDEIKSGLESLKSVPGRFEKITTDAGFCIIVDYAHTPDGMKQVLSTARDLTPNRIITVFGCGGDRDRLKRPQMGRISSELSDYTIITSDNPRTEDPMKIIEEIIQGIKDTSSSALEIIPDRKSAIRRAIELAKENDLVMILGKGHETYQVLKDTVVPFDDRQVAKKYLLNF